MDSSHSPVRLEPAENVKKPAARTVVPRGENDDDWARAQAGDREASRRLELAVFGLAPHPNSTAQNGIESLVSDENPETNPFVAAIRDNFGAHAANAPPPAQPPAPQKEDTAMVKSPTPPPASSGQETAPTVRTGVEMPAAVKNQTVLIGDFGSHQLQILNANKTEGHSFAVDGSATPIRFDSGLDLGPVQSFVFSQPSSQDFPDMLIMDRRYGLVDIYAGIASGKFAFKDGFTFSGGEGEMDGAAAVDIDGDGAKDLVVATHILAYDSSNQGFLYIFLSRNSAFTFQKRIPLAFPAGGLYSTRLGEQVGILAVNQTLSFGELVVLDTNIAVTMHAENLTPTRRQDAKLNFTDGRPVWMRLVEFAEFGIDVNFIGAFEDRDFYLVGVLDNLRPFPFLALGDLEQKGQRRCWIRF